MRRKRVGLNRGSVGAAWFAVLALNRCLTATCGGAYTNNNGSAPADGSTSASYSGLAATATPATHSSHRSSASGPS